MVVCDTGPLISAFQSNSFSLLREVLGELAVPRAVAEELERHGWGEELRDSAIHVVDLIATEVAQAVELARQIAKHSRNIDRVGHDGESQAIVLACRSKPTYDLLLIDERAGRESAKSIGLEIVGFPGVLLMGCKAKLITPNEIKLRLQECRQQGTYYGESLIESVYQKALTVRRT